MPPPTAVSKFRIGHLVVAYVQAVASYYAEGKYLKATLLKLLSNKMHKNYCSAAGIQKS